MTPKNINTVYKSKSGRFAIWLEPYMDGVSYWHILAGDGGERRDEGMDGWGPYHDSRFTAAPNYEIVVRRGSVFVRAK
jgi:hypothetical protein